MVLQLKATRITKTLFKKPKLYGKNKKRDEHRNADYTVSLFYRPPTRPPSAKKSAKRHKRP